MGAVQELFTVLEYGQYAFIEFRMMKISEEEKVYIYRDIDENEKCRYNYLHCMELGKKGYT